LKTKYLDLIEQTLDFPQEEFYLENKRLFFHGINLMELIDKYGTPLRFNYLPKITENIQKVKSWFETSIQKMNYSGSYYYSYCTKSSHFSFILDEVLKNDTHIETSSAYDLYIIKKLRNQRKISNNIQVICNGYKTQEYIDLIASLRGSGFNRIFPIIDNLNELDQLAEKITKKTQIGIRIASEEEPKFEFYTSRLGISYTDILPFYRQKIADNKLFNLKMLHFFINTGIADNSYYWNELRKSLRVYASLKKECSSLDSINIGGGFPIKNSLSFEYDYEYMIGEIILQIQNICKEENIPEPNIYTEFGSYTVGESGGILMKVIGQKQQNDREKWNMVDSSFMTTLPDSWAISKRFLMLPINGWGHDYERVFFRWFNL
jgi:arginine decarboxylase